MKKMQWLLALASMLWLSPLPASAQTAGSDVYWRLDPAVKSCSMVIDPSLSQGEWRTFVQQVGAISTFKNLGPAEPLGAGRFSIAIERSSTPVNQRDPAWINTFVHPDADCPLGDAIVIPGLRARVGITDDLDGGAFWTTAPNANYGMLGGELRYRLMRETGDLPVVAARGTVTVLTGVADYDIQIYAAELSASKRISFISPYAGVRYSLAHGVETTSKVDLAPENVAFAQGYAGLAYSFWVLTASAEYNVSHVNTFAVALAFGM